MGDRVAILVIHGMGTQKPYETLDQFARGIEGLVNLPGQAPGYARTLEYREHPSDPARQQEHWTQAIVRFRSLATKDSEQPALIDLVEYYWAPIINGRVKALQSLLFLIRSALSPFDYLRDNLIAIAQVSDERSGKIAESAVQEGLPKTSKVAIVNILFREFLRIGFIFFPMLLLMAGIYALLARPLLSALVPERSASWLAYFWSGTPSWISVVVVAVAALRWLLLLMTGKFLFDAISHKDNPSPQFRPLLFRCNLIVALIFLLLIVAPFLGPFSAFLLCTGIAAYQLSPEDQQHLHGFLRWLHFRIAYAPPSLRVLHVVAYLGLAVLIYFVNRFLTTAIGDLAVYLGADTLSTNFAARSQILEECTQTLLTVLGPQGDLVPDHTPCHYDRVILAAHSLGSVIAYDTLNDLMSQNMASPVPGEGLGRISGLFTFGCPLNKVFYFFRARTSAKTYVLNQILYSLHNLLSAGAAAGWSSSLARTIPSSISMAQRVVSNGCDQRKDALLPSRP